MPRSSLMGLAISLVVAVGAWAQGRGASSDRIAFENVPAGEEWGVLIDGTTASGPVDDRVATGTEPVLTLENFRAGADSREEVVAVVRDRALALVENAPWTDEEGDVVSVEFAPVIEIPLTLWIVTGPFEQGHDLAVEELLTLGSLWREQRMGIRAGDVEIVDATGNEKASLFSDFTCSQRSALESAIGSRPGRVDVYLVESVGGSYVSAEACDFGSGFAALARFASSDVLAHELGHSFGLEHTDEVPGFDRSNVMAAASSIRAYLTEGQTFRAHVDPGSVINALYGARPGEPVRDCPHAAVSSSCPALDTRIWPDAPSPP